MMRLFIALDLPEDVKERLQRLKRGAEGVRWLPPEQLHLTLLFLGDVPDEALTAICRGLAAISTASFELRLAKTGCFPGRSRPRVLWVAPDHQPALHGLAARIRETVLACGIQLEQRGFSPHVTVARIKENRPCETARFLDAHVQELSLAFEVREFILFQSTLTAQGALHRDLLRIPLKQAG